jgi:hypothetical protein
VVLRSGLREPYITTVSTQLTTFNSVSDIFADTNGTTSGVDEPSTLLHLGDEFLVEHTLGLLVERAVDSNDIGLTEHFLEILNSPAANFLGCFRVEGLVVEVKEFLAIEGDETSQDSFTDTADTNGCDNLAFDIEWVLGNGCDVPITGSNLFMGRDKVTDESEHGENDVLSDGNYIGSSNFSNQELLLVGSSKINMIGT